MRVVCARPPSENVNTGVSVSVSDLELAGFHSQSDHCAYTL